MRTTDAVNYLVRCALSTIRKRELEVERVIGILKPGPLGILEHKFSQTELHNAEGIVAQAREKWKTEVPVPLWSPLARCLMEIRAPVSWSLWRRMLSYRAPQSVAVAMSGGVDSSVAALLLQRQGYNIFGIFMRNWDSSDEAGTTVCSAEQDFTDAQKVCNQLGMKLHKVDYHRQYWTDVFETFVDDSAAGLTPNPDLACNKFIKFDALFKSAMKMGADKLATGHYARLLHHSDGAAVQLLRGVDLNKDQSYFLASVPGKVLERVLFPLGSLRKSEVRQLAVSEALVTASKRSSAGICFLGRRNFPEFISQYVQMSRGPFIDVHTCSRIGTHEGIAAYTNGQRSRIGGEKSASYVVGKDLPNNVVFVASGPDHPALFCTSAIADSLSWVSGELPSTLAEGRALRCFYKARYSQSLEKCIVCLASAQAEDVLGEGLGVAGTRSGEFRPSSFCRLQYNAPSGEILQVRFASPARAITPGQALVLYLGDVCLGAARFLYPGPTLFEQEDRTETFEAGVQRNVSSAT